MNKRTMLRAALCWSFAALALVIAGCGGASGRSGSSTGTMTVGFVMVGSRSDSGYNQAVYDASQAVAKDMPTVRAITSDNVPENNSVHQAMQSMVDQGAKVIFATSYGYFSQALKFAQEHPDIVVVHQGGFQKGTFPPNFGTYWGEAYEPVSLGGMAAGGLTKTNIRLRVPDQPDDCEHRRIRTGRAEGKPGRAYLSDQYLELV
jgi:basic membrane protein A